MLLEREKGQTDVSKALGVSQPTVSTWMTAKKVPKMETVDALCAYLHCRRFDLLEEHNAAPLEDARRELVRLAMTAELENVKTALILLSALEQKKCPARVRRSCGTRGAMDWDKQSRDRFRLSAGAQNVNKKGGNVHKGIK